MSLKYHGHTFADSAICTCCDANKAVVVDPTNTGKLRAKFRAEMRRRWTQMRILSTQMIKERDLLAIKSGGLMAVHNPGLVGGASKIDVFQRWFDMALGNVVLQGDGSWMRRYLQEGYTAGQQFGMTQAKSNKEHKLAQHRTDALITLARVELQGVIEAVSQQALRAVSEGLLADAKPMAIVRRVLNVIEKIGVTRSTAMIELLVVRAHAEASLDVYEAAGIASVGLVPEAKAKVVTDATTQQKAQVTAKDAKRKAGPGSRSSRTQTPSRSTIGRIRRSELNIARRLGEHVNVRTAGDDDVCPTCEAISENGPYTINRARALIPAHPRCRCVFVPAFDKRFAEDTHGRQRSLASELGNAGS